MSREMKIIMPYGGVKKVEKSTGFSKPTIRWALRGYAETKSAKLIRKRALELGGVLSNN